MTGESSGEGPEGGGPDPSLQQQQQPEGPAQEARGDGQTAVQGSQGRSNVTMTTQPQSQQQQPPPSPFLQRAMHPAPSSSTSGTSGSSFEGTMRSQQLPTLPETEVSDGSWMLGLGATAHRRPPVPGRSGANGHPPQPPAAPRLPPAALLSGASSISIASPFMQSQIAFSATDSEGSSRWRSGAFTPTPPSGTTPSEIRSPASEALSSVEGGQALSAEAPAAQPQAAPPAAYPATVPKAEAGVPETKGEVAAARVAKPASGGSDWGPLPTGGGTPEKVQQAPGASAQPGQATAAPASAAAEYGGLPSQAQAAVFLPPPAAGPAAGGGVETMPGEAQPYAGRKQHRGVHHHHHHPQHRGHRAGLPSTAAEAGAGAGAGAGAAGIAAPTSPPAPSGQDRASGSDGKGSKSSSGGKGSKSSSGGKGSKSSSGGSVGGRTHATALPAVPAEPAGGVPAVMQPPPMAAPAQQLQVPPQQAQQVPPQLQPYPAETTGPLAALPVLGEPPGLGLQPPPLQLQPHHAYAAQLAQLQQPLPQAGGEQEQAQQQALPPQAPPSWAQQQPAGLPSAAPASFAGQPSPAMQHLPIALLAQQQQAMAAALQQEQAAAMAASAAAAANQQQQQQAAMAAALQQEQAAAMAASAAPAFHPGTIPAGMHPAAAAALATADPATQAAILAAMQHQQQAQAAAAAAGQQQVALAAQQQQQQAVLASQQQQQQQALLGTQYQAASLAVAADQQQQHSLLEGQLHAQAVLGSQHRYAQHALLGAQQQASSAATAAAEQQHAAALAAAAMLPPVPQQPPPPPQQQQWPALGGMPPYPVPYPALTPLPAAQLQQLYQPALPALMERQPSQALSGYSVGSELPVGAAQHMAYEQVHALPYGEAALRYSPAVSRSSEGIGFRSGEGWLGAAGLQQQRALQRQQQQQRAQQGDEEARTASPRSAFAAAASRGLGMGGQGRQRIKAVVSSGGHFRQPGGGAGSGGSSVAGGAASISAAAPGSWTYEGGETRLVSLPDSCSLLELLAVLSAKKQRPQAPAAAYFSPASHTPAGGDTAGTAGTAAHAPGGASPSPGAGGATSAGTLSLAASTQGSATGHDRSLAAVGAASSLGSVGADSLRGSALAGAAAAVAAAAGGRASGLQKLCIVRYKLPSEPGLFVDVVDDEDVRLMFEELQDWVNEGPVSGGGTPLSRKLHLFVEWLPAQPTQRASAESADSDLRQAVPGPFTPSESSVEEQVQMQMPLMPAGSIRTKVSDLKSTKIEVIPSGDVVLVAHVGTGTFGDTYRGRWHESDVAVKCINPLMIGVQYASRQAWVDFLRDANQMGKLRHGNLCEVYGVVLPHDSDPRLSAPRSRSEPAAGTSAAAAAAGVGDRQQGQQEAGQPPNVSAPEGASEQVPGQGRGEGHAATPPSSPVSSAAAAATVSPAAAADATLMQRKATLPAVANTMPQTLPATVANPPAIVMEYVSGKSLGNAIACGSSLVSGRLARVVYALDTAKALSYLHSRKVAHLDLKSGNVLLGWRDRRPTAKIVGYGLTGRKVSMARRAAQGCTSSASMLPWVAPEVLRTPEYVTGKADVYSFAVVMWELWALKVPYEGQDPMELLARVQQGEVLRPPLPGTQGEPEAEEPGPGWRGLLERCWAEDPEQRPDFSVIEEVLRDIAREVKRQQGQPRPRAAIPLPRAASRPGASLLRRAGSGAGSASAARRQASGAGALRRQGSGAGNGQQAPGTQRTQRSVSGFMINQQAGSGVWAPDNDGGTAAVAVQPQGEAAELAGQAQQAQQDGPLAEKQETEEEKEEEEEEETSEESEVEEEETEEKEKEGEVLGTPEVAPA